MRANVTAATTATSELTASHQKSTPESCSQSSTAGTRPTKSAVETTAGRPTAQRTTQASGGCSVDAGPTVGSRCSTCSIGRVGQVDPIGRVEALGGGGNVTMAIRRNSSTTLDPAVSCMVVVSAHPTKHAASTSAWAPLVRSLGPGTNRTAAVPMR